MELEKGARLAAAAVRPDVGTAAEVAEIDGPLHPRGNVA
jgi:hypothetical protein